MHSSSSCLLPNNSHLLTVISRHFSRTVAGTWYRVATLLLHSTACTCHPVVCVYADQCQDTNAKHLLSYTIHIHLTPRTYSISTATCLKYVTLVLHSTFYVCIWIGQHYKAVQSLLTMAAASAPSETAHAPPPSSARP